MASRRKVIAVVITATLAVLLGCTMERVFKSKLYNAADYVKYFQPLVYYFCRCPASVLSKFGHKWMALWVRATLHPIVRLSQFAAFINDTLAVEDTEFDSIPVRIYNPKQRQSNGALVFLHGGGFVLFNLNSYDALARDLAMEAGMLTVSVNYRLAPEHLYPAAVEDCERAVVHFLSGAYEHYDVDPTKVVLIGDSAGGNLVAVITQRLRRIQALPSVKLQVLIYPLVQLLDFNNPSYCNAKHAYREQTVVDPENIARFMMTYLGFDEEVVPSIVSNAHASALSPSQEHLLNHLSHKHLPDMFRSNTCPIEIEPQSPKVVRERVKVSMKRLEAFLFDPSFSPILAQNLSNLPAALVVTCEYDALRDEGFLYAKRLHEHGTKVAWWHLPKGFHGMFNAHRLFPLARLAVSRIGRFVAWHVEQPAELTDDKEAFAFPQAQFLP